MGRGRAAFYVRRSVRRELIVKICAVCGAENESEYIRCCVCQAVLPETEVLSPPIRSTEQMLVRLCDRCGAVCNKNAIKCTKCGQFLKGPRVCSKATEAREPAPLTARADSGEILTLTAGQVIGRQYQPKIWDAYAPRALYKVHFTDGRYVLENLKDLSFRDVDYETDYKIGRKKMRFEEKQ